MASVASDMFVGRERFATLLMMRLTETVILWLSEDQSFWEEIEEGDRPLGPLGLQQVLILFSLTYILYYYGQSETSYLLLLFNVDLFFLSCSFI